MFRTGIISARDEKDPGSYWQRVCICANQSGDKRGNRTFAETSVRRLDRHCRKIVLNSASLCSPLMINGGRTLLADTALRLTLVHCCHGWNPTTVLKRRGMNFGMDSIIKETLAKPPMRQFRILCESTVKEAARIGIRMQWS